MAEQTTQDNQDPALSEEQIAQVQAIATEAVRDALAQAAAEASKTPADRLREGYAANKPAA